MKRYYATKEQKDEDTPANEGRTHPPISTVEVVPAEGPDIKGEPVLLDDIVGPPEMPLPTTAGLSEVELRADAEAAASKPKPKSRAVRRKASKANYPHNDQGGA